MSEPNLADRTCQPLPAGSPPLTEPAIRKLLEGAPGWQYEGGQVTRVFRFKNYYETMAFVNAVAFVAHRTDHHPDMAVGYNQLAIHYSTHSVGGISINDLICAAKVNALQG